MVATGRHTQGRRFGVGERIDIGSSLEQQFDSVRLPTHGCIV